MKWARVKLRDLGQDVAPIDAALSYRDVRVFEDDSASLDAQDADAAREQQWTAASTDHIGGELRLAQGSAADLANLNRITNILGSQPSTQQLQASEPISVGEERPVKRKRGSPQQYSQKQRPDDEHEDKMSSRDAMPPPQLPSNNTMFAHTPRPIGHRNGTFHDRRNTVNQTPQTSRHFGVHTNDVPSRMARDQADLAPHQSLPRIRNEHSNAARFRPHNLSNSDQGPALHLAQNLDDDAFHTPKRSSSTTIQPAFLSYDPSSISNLPQPQSQNQSNHSQLQDPVRVTSSNYFLHGNRNGNTGGASQLPAPSSHLRGSSFNLSEQSQLSNSTSHPYGQSFIRSPHDGELDQLLRPTPPLLHPTPQRPLHRPSSVSPIRNRLTLPPTPRNSSAGLFSHVRSSSTNMGTPHSTASHRQQLGISPQVLNGLSFLEEPNLNMGGRRRARR